MDISKTLIISQSSDLSTNEVIRWLRFYGKKFTRINDDDEIVIENILINQLDTDIVLTNTATMEKFSLKDFNSVWYRRGRARMVANKRFVENDLETYVQNKPDVIKILNRYSDDEASILNEFIYDYLENDVQVSVGKQSNSINNKLIHLKIAKSLGIDIPKSFVGPTSNFTSDGKYITKAIRDGISLSFDVHDKAYYFMMYTNIVNPIHYRNGNSCRNMLLQKRLEKKYELRIFFFNGKFYSMAIFSQRDVKTAIDFRRYNTKKPNRNVPYNLPAELEQKLRTLMNRLKLNTGSIDMVVTKDNKFVFLEVNPVGQYGMVSYPCNYNLDSLIAQYLQ